MSTHGGEDIHGQCPGNIPDKHKETRSLENMKKPEEREKRKRRKKSLPFLPIFQLVRCSTDFLSSIHGHVLVDIHRA
jgi:hypothetical protein